MLCSIPSLYLQLASLDDSYPLQFGKQVVAADVLRLSPHFQRNDYNPLTVNGIIVGRWLCANP